MGKVQAVTALSASLFLLLLKAVINCALAVSSLRYFRHTEIKAFNRLLQQSQTTKQQHKRCNDTNNTASWWLLAN